MGVNSPVKFAKTDHVLWTPTAFESRPGTYALLLSSATDRVGRLGNLRLKPGFYVYVGSALGPGGVRARLAHQMRFAERPHWHIDYLRRHATIEEVWFTYDRKSREHEWARCFAEMKGALMPRAGFGSSDCDCESQLFFFKKRPSRDGLNRCLKIDSGAKLSKYHDAACEESV